MLLIAFSSATALANQAPKFEYQGYNSAPFVFAERINSFPVGSTVDLNNDGLLDVVSKETISGDPYLVIYLQNTDGSFSNSSFVRSLIPDNKDIYAPIVASDFDNDGDIDFATGGPNGGNYMYQNTGSIISPNLADGVLHPNGFYTAAMGSGDLDNDGELDVIWLKSDAYSIAYGPWDSGNNSWNAVVETQLTNSNGHNSNIGTDVTVKDADGDGDLDMFISHNVATDSAGVVRILINNGARSYTHTSISSSDSTLFDVTNELNPMALTVGDVNNDGKNDIVFFNQDTELNKLIVGLRTSTNLATPTYSFSVIESAHYDSRADFDFNRRISLGDVNNDGNLDLLASGPYTKTQLYFGDGSGGFNYANTIIVESNAIPFADFNADGYLDVMAYNKIAYQDNLYTASVAENSTLVINANATDLDGDTLTYTISGTDSSLFTINASTGLVNFTSAPNFEMPTDNGLDNVYDFVVTATDNGSGTLTTSRAVVVTVTNLINEAPVFTGIPVISGAVLVGKTLSVSNTSTSDDAADTVTLSYQWKADGVDIVSATVSTYTLTSNESGKAITLELTASDGLLNTMVTTIGVNVPAMSNDADGDGISDVDEVGYGTDPQVTDTDGDGYDDNLEPIGGNNASMKPSPAITSNGGVTGTVNVVENTTLVTTITTANAVAPLIYSLSGGADQTKFSINTLTGALSFIDPPDFETPASTVLSNDYVVIISVTDGISSESQALIVTVTDETPEANPWDARSSTNERGELFLGGHFIELGISSWGDFGTESNKPSNFYGTKVRDSIGMSTDPDGFGQGEDLRMDYFLPGTPEERFVVGYKESGVNYNNSNSALMGSKIMTTTVEDNSAGTTLSATIKSTWTDKMSVKQVISFEQDSSFYRTEVTISNISGHNWDSARFMRSFDPDNTPDLGGSYSTRNAITNTHAAGDGRAIVKAETYSHGDPVYQKNGSRMPILFYSKDTRAKVSNFGFSNSNVYAAAAYDSAPAKGTVNLSDSAITIAFEELSLANGKSAKFVYYTSLDERDFDEVYEELKETEEPNDDLPPADEPVVVADLLEINGTPVDITDTGSAYSFVPMVTNSDGDAITFSIANKPSWVMFNTATGEINGTPAHSDAGTYSDVSITVEDAAGNSDSLAPFSILAVSTNAAPSLAGVPSTSVDEGVNYSFTPTLTDVDLPIDTHRFTVTNLPSWAEFELSTGTVSGKPSSTDAGNYNAIVINVEDGVGAVASLTSFDITVNDVNLVPRFTSGTLFSVDEGSIIVDTLAAYDEDGDTLTYSISGGDDGALFGIDGTTGALKFLTAPTFNAPNSNTGTNVYLITVSVTDGISTTQTQDLAVTVIDINDAPVISGIPTLEVNALEEYIFIPNATDNDVGDTKTFSIINKPVWASFNTQTGKLTGIPSVDQLGDVTNISISVVDSMNVKADLIVFTVSVLAAMDSDGDGVPDVKEREEGTDPTNPADVKDTDGDGVPDYVEEREGTKPTVTGDAKDTDGDGVPDYIEMREGTEPTIHGDTKDTDGDGVSDYVETQLGTDPEGGADTPVDTDGDGIADRVNHSPEAVDDVIDVISGQSITIDVLSNDIDLDGDTLTIDAASTRVGEIKVVNQQLSYQTQDGYTGSVIVHYNISDEYNAQASTVVLVNVLENGTSVANKPLILPPEDVSVNATGLFTKVDLGVATATDSSGRTLPVSLVDGITFFRPGKNIAYWEATDDKGNRSVVSQFVLVSPLVSFSKHQNIGEGDSVTVDVLLNGLSPEYPLVIEYQVAGNSTVHDHDLDLDADSATGTVTIEDGTRGSISFKALLDEVDEENETVEFSFVGEVNSQHETSHIVTIEPDNNNIKVGLFGRQAQEERSFFAKDQGEVTIFAGIEGASVSDLAITWSAEPSISNIDSNDFTFIFDPSLLPIDLYQVNVKVKNLITGDIVTSKLHFNISEMLADLSGQDSDGDNIPDNLEGYADNDLDGIPDYIDAISECNVISTVAGESDGYLVESEPGTCLRLGKYSLAGQSIKIPEANVKQVLVEDESYQNVGGVFDYISHGLPEHGQAVSVVLPQDRPIPEGGVYRKLMPAGWSDFTVDSENAVYSTPGEAGYCPPPGDEVWLEGLVAGSWCVKVKSSDGGPNDFDEEANGILVDPAGVYVLTTTNALPQTVTDSIDIIYNTEITINVLANDTDADGDVLTLTTVDANLGTVNIVGEKIHYVPIDNYYGVDVIRYGVSDGRGGTATGLVNITIVLNNAPVVVNDIATTDDRTAITIDVLANDSDADGDILTIGDALAVKGSVEIVNNQIIYTPLAAFDGIDTISYVAEDGQGGQTLGEVAVTITAYKVVEETKASGGSFGILSIFFGSFLMIFRRKAISQKRCKNVLLTALGLGSLFAVSAQAISVQKIDAQTQDAPQLGWYLGGEFGFAKTDVNKADFNQFYQNSNLDANALSVDDSGLMTGLFLGYQFNRYFGFEGGYLNLGERSLTFEGNSTDITTFHDNAEHIYPQSGKGFSLNATAAFPISEDFKVAARIGYFDWEGDYDLSNYIGNVGSDSVSGTDLWFSAELNYRVSKNLQAYVSAAQFELARDTTNVLSLGVRYFFNDDYRRLRHSVSKALNDEAEQTVGPIQVAQPTLVAQSMVDNPGNEAVTVDNTVTDIAAPPSVAATAILPETVYIHFPIDGAELTKEDRSNLGDVKKLLTANPSLGVVVNGYASSSGSIAYNEQLSLWRAHNVQKALYLSGVAHSRMSVNFHGEYQQSDKLADQRAEIEFYHADEPGVVTQMEISFGIFSDRLTRKDIAEIKATLSQLDITKLQRIELTSYAKVPGDELGLIELAVSRAKKIESQLKSEGINVPMTMDYLLLNDNEQYQRRKVEVRFIY